MKDPIREKSWKRCEFSWWTLCDFHALEVTTLKLQHIQSSISRKGLVDNSKIQAVRVLRLGYSQLYLDLLLLLSLAFSSTLTRKASFPPLCFELRVTTLICVICCVFQNGHAYHRLLLNISVVSFDWQKLCHSVQCFEGPIFGCVSHDDVPWEPTTSS